MSKINLDEIAQELDPVKMLMFFLAFVAISLIVIFALIVPDVKKYKKAKKESYRYELQTKRASDVLDEEKKRLQDTTKQNLKIINALNSGFNTDKFKQFAQKFFDNVSLSKQTSAPEANGFTVYELNVTSSIKSPSSFYDFIDALPNYENVIKADFPINMTSHGNKIKSSFNIKVYQKLLN